MFWKRCLIQLNSKTNKDMLMCPFFSVQESMLIVWILNDRQI